MSRPTNTADKAPTPTATVDAETLTALLEKAGIDVATFTAELVEKAAIRETDARVTAEIAAVDAMWAEWSAAHATYRASLVAQLSTKPAAPRTNTRTPRAAATSDVTLGQRRQWHDTIVKLEADGFWHVESSDVTEMVGQKYATLSAAAKIVSLARGGTASINGPREFRVI